MPSFRNILRWIFLALALAFIVWTAPEMIHNFREWRASAGSDPVAAQFWRAVFYMDFEEIAIAAGVGIVMWLVLKPRRRAARISAQL